MSNFRVHHGLQDFTDVPDVWDALGVVKSLLEAGKTNVLITQADLTVTGHSDYDKYRDDGRVMTLVLEIPIGPGLRNGRQAGAGYNEKKGNDDAND